MIVAKAAVNQAALVTLASNEVLVFDLTAIFSSLLILESQEA